MRLERINVENETHKERRQEIKINLEEGGYIKVCSEAMLKN